MSLLKCDSCGILIDTDEHPEAYDYALNRRTGEDKWWCWSCFPDYDSVEAVSVQRYKNWTQGR